MNRYESAYRDYTTQRDVDDFPQRPERKHRTAERALPRLDSRSSVESNSFEQQQQQQARTAHQQHGFTSDEENYHAAHPISSRELFDRGGERGNPEFIITTDAIQRYPRSPSLGSRSHSDGEGGVNPHDVDRYYDGNSHHNPAVDNDIIGQVPEIYIPNPEYLTRFPASELSQGSYKTYRSAPYSEDATLRSKKSKRGGIVIESTRAPHPLCPNTRSCCCLMLLFNLGLLLICLGFVIVLQLDDPPFVWFLGVFMLVFGFISLVVGLIFCAWMCREGSPDAPVPPSQFYWTHRWRKTINLPESHGRIHESTIKTPIDDIHYLDETDSYHNGPRYHNNGRY